MFPLVTRLAPLAVLLFSTAAAGAQTSHSGAALGATLVGFGSNWGGSIPALSAELRTSWRVAKRHALEVQSLAVLPLGATSVIPDCLPGGVCSERRTPEFLGAGLLALGVDAWDGALRLTAGAGAVGATGMVGPGSTSSAVGTLGVTWSRRRPGVAPTLGIRSLALATPIAGMRVLVIPAVGLRF